MPAPRFYRGAFGLNVVEEPGGSLNQPGMQASASRSCAAVDLDTLPGQGMIAELSECEWLPVIEQMLPFPLIAIAGLDLSGVKYGAVGATFQDTSVARLRHSLDGGG